MIKLGGPGRPLGVRIPSGDYCGELNKFSEIKEMAGKRKIPKRNDCLGKSKLRNSWLIRSSGVIPDHKLIKQPVTTQVKKFKPQPPSCTEMNIEEHYI